MSDKIKTGISNLDTILGGGIPQGHCVLLSGSCGTGKTVLSQQFLFNNAYKQTKGIYFSLTEPKEKMIQNLSGFSFFDRQLVDMGMVSVLDLNTNARLKGVGLNNPLGLVDVIVRSIEENNAKLIALDSLTALCQSLQSDDKIREFIFELNLQMTYLGCTSLLISEIPPFTTQYSVFGVEEFIADGVILLSEIERKGDLIRALQVIKMRGTVHSRNKHVLEIMDDGINLVPMFKSQVE
ncbi:MAG: circadian clock protein KaiC [Candidatus Altiarchaeales archaeon]|nr:circadian clock protein KaiC [Candidatus Altiarchaeales archaeon]